MILSRTITLVAAALLAPPAAYAASFTFTDLDVPGYLSTQISGLPGALSESDVVVGTTQQAKGMAPVGFSWSAGTFSLYPAVRELNAVGNNGIAAGLPASGAGYATVNTSTGAVATYTDGFRGTPEAIDNAGQIAAQTKAGQIGYLLEAGAETPLKVPNATSTTPTGINAGGTVLGSYYSASSDGGFSYLNGTYNEFVVPGSVNVNPLFIQSNGVIGGSFTSGTADTLVGFVKRGDNYFLYAPAESMASSVYGIGPGGEVVGTWSDPHGGIHSRGFIFLNHTFSYIDYPGAVGTSVTGVNARGSLVGTWYDAHFVYHPFIAQCPQGQTCTQ
jgi:hypothetical protein